MIRSVSIRNFRCLREVDSELSGLTALVGANGAGKSAFLSALRFFFGEIEPDALDCWGGDAELIIEVALRIELPDVPEFATYRDDDGCAWVARRSEAEEPKRQTSYVIRRRGNPDFAALRAATAATPAKEAYNELRAGDYGDLPPWANFGALPGFLADWESTHPEALVWTEDGSVGFGGGNLDISNHVELLFVPAVRDAATESADSKPSVLRTLVERIVNPKALFADAANALDDEVRAKYSAMVAEAGDSLDGASDAISERLAGFAPGSRVQLDWDGHPPVVGVPGVRARLVEGGHATEVGRQGHGVQRAYILALLHELALGGGPGDGHGALLLMMIEEPELYQHPARARLLARVLSDLSASVDTGAQVVYATHSPHFVGLDRIEALRLFRLGVGVDVPSTTTSGVDLQSLAQELWVAAGSPGEPFTRESLLPRLRLLAEVPVADGFFADGVVLVEGDEDRALLVAATQDAGLDLDAHNVAVIPVGGKSNLDRPLIVFRQLGIPTYVLFDGDGSLVGASAAPNERENERLTALLSGTPHGRPETAVLESWAPFTDSFERTVRQEIGEGRWDDALRAAADDAGYAKVEQAKKNPLVLLDVYRRAKAEGGNSATLSAIIGAVRARFGI